MANSSGLNRTGVLSRVTVAAITAALVGTTTAAVAAEAPVAAQPAVSTPAASASAASATAVAAAAVEHRALQGVSGSSLYWYAPNGSGGYDAREYANSTWNYIKAAQQADNDGDGIADDVWAWSTSGYLSYAAGESASTELVNVGGGWNIYNKLVSPGQLGGGAAADIIARDSSGVLWLYLGYGNGRLTTRYKVGGGWNAYNQIAGVGDLSGDGKADIVARDGSGVLWLYKGTGNYTSPFAGRTKIGGGWGVYNTILGVGDLDYDGIADFLARDGAGKLYRYSGTGNAAAPFKPRVTIGTSGWNTYRIMF
ncbi:FG-GAP repeat domain-containing protein [Streptomyces sp. NPDC013171]|uniref:FG-GAP repeat domain-containing protein n=1 Tax=Streptomyces sp. NPDC013171 TaxID=3364863 RepID=UPI0036C62A95